MSDTRRHFSAEEKVSIVRRHLVEKTPVSDLCDQYQLNPNVFYRWQKELFEHAAAGFERAGKSDRASRKLEQQNAALKAKLAHKDEVIAEIMQDHVQLKKSLGEV